jgi:hypothetical protein
MLSVRKVFILAISLFFLASCEVSDGVIYCIEFVPTDAFSNENLIQNRTFDVKQLKVKAIYGNDIEKEVFNGENTWDDNNQTIFIDFTHSDEPSLHVKILKFELPSGEVQNFDLNVNADYDDNGLVDYDLMYHQRLICNSCQKGIKEITF